MLENKEPHKCDQLDFFPLEKLPDTVAPFVQQALECIQKGIHYSECGWSYLRERSFAF